MSNADKSSNFDKENISGQPKAPAPESLEAKFKLLAALPYDPRVRRKHMLVYGFILDWYHSKYGDALASVRHIARTLQERDPAGKGLYSGDIHGALSDLVAWDYLHQEKGSGRRASRYVPNWALACSVRENPNTTEADRSVRESPNASVRETPNANAVCVRESPNEDPSTRTRSTDQGTRVDGPEGPGGGGGAAPASGLSAGPGDAPPEGFEELWRAYGVRKQKADARRAYEKLAPGPELHAQMVEAARAWREAWEAQGKPDAPRKALKGWIEQELYDCDPPTAYKAPERKRAKPEPATPAPEPASHGEPEPEPEPADFIAGYVRPGRHVVWIVDTETKERGGDIELVVHLQNEADNERWSKYKHHIVLQSPDAKRQDAGQLALARLCAAAGFDVIEDAEELHGESLLASITERGAVSYEPLAANDNNPAGEVAV